jgi:hypothetical protein
MVGGQIELRQGLRTVAKVSAREVGARRHLWLLVPLASALPWWSLLLALSALKSGCS